MRLLQFRRLSCYSPGMSSGKDGWADVIGEQTDPDLGKLQEQGEAPTLSETATPLTLPAPQPAPTEAAPPPAPGQFSVEDMVDKLQAGKVPPSTGPSFWAEWREVILTGVLGGAALVGLALFPWGNAEPEVESIAIEKPAGAQPAPKADQTPKSRAERRPLRAPQPPATPAKTRPAPAPVVSVVSTPPGAMVQIDGVVYGRTPLILPAPAGRRSLDVVLMLNDHKNFEQVIEASEAGHFSLNVKLQPRR